MYAYSFDFFLSRLCLVLLANNFCVQSLLSDFKSEGRTLSVLPPGLVNQSKDEAEYLGFHKCSDAGEAYGASYLITKEHLIQHNTNYSLNWVNCEMASFIMMKNRNPNLLRGAPGTIIQALDVLDFSAIHLSAYERSQRKYARLLKKQKYPETIEVPPSTVYFF